MKFLIEPVDYERRSGRTHPSERANGQSLFDNILNPSSKVQCGSCKRDISLSSRVMVESEDFCCGCFANCEEFPPEYSVANKLDFPLFEHRWTAHEELLLFEALEKHGFGNWGDIAECMGTGKTRDEVEEHYHFVYLIREPDCPAPPISARDYENNLVDEYNSPYPPRQPYPPRMQPQLFVSTKPQRPLNTLTQPKPPNSSLPDLLGYMPRRGDFQIEYDNDAELLLAEMQFLDDEPPQQRNAKFRLLDIYNHKLSERIKRKEFVISRNLLELKQAARMEKARTKEEKEIHSMMRVLARFSSMEEHEGLVQGIIREKQLRQRIEEVNELIRTRQPASLGELQDELLSKRRKDDKGKRKQNESAQKSKMRRRRTETTVEKTDKRVLSLNRHEEELCRAYAITVRQYMTMKEILIKEAVKKGSIERSAAIALLPAPTHVGDAVFTFLVRQEDIPQLPPADLLIVPSLMEQHI